MGVRRVLVGLTPHLFATNALGYRFDPQAPAPARGPDVLAPVLGAARIDTRPERVGGLLLGGMSNQKIFMFIGRTRSGKGTIVRVLSAIVGKENVTFPKIGHLQERFGTQTLIDKTLAVVTDARISARADTSSLLESLLSISGEDSQVI